MHKQAKDNALSTASKSTYDSLQRTFLDICRGLCFKASDIDEFELGLVAICFVLYHSVNSLDSFLSAVQKLWHSWDAGPLPRGAEFSDVKAGLKRLLAAPDQRRQADALLVKDLQTIFTRLSPHVFAHVRFKAQACLSFSMVFRTQDHTGGRLRFKHVFIASDNALEVHVPPGKSSEGYTLLSAMPVVWGLPLYQSIVDYLDFIPLSSRRPDAPFFQEDPSIMSAVSRGRFTAQLKMHARRSLGKDPSRIAGYSLRRGAVTEAVSRGVPGISIQHQGKWRSDMWHVYFDRGAAQRREFSATR